MSRKNRVKFRPPQVWKLRRGNEDFRDVWHSKYWGSGSSRRIDLAQAIKEAIEWDKHMARKTYRIELKVDFADDASHEIMLGIAKQYARDLLGSAMLLQDKSKPAVVLMTDDSFHGVDVIDLMDASEELHTP